MIDLMPPRDRPQPRTPSEQLLAARPISLRFTSGQRDGLEFLAAARGVALGAVVREAVEAHLQGFTDASGRTLLEVADDGELTGFVVPDLGPDDDD